MQSEIRVCCRASPPVHGASDVQLPAHPTKRVLRQLKNPLSKRAREDARQTELLTKAWKESGRVYGYRKLHEDLLDQGEKHHNLEHSKSRRGNCHDNAVAESFFNLLKRERIRRRTCRTREEARQDAFDDIEMFYNRNECTSGTGCCHPWSSNGGRKCNPAVSTKLGAIQRAKTLRPATTAM